MAIADPDEVAITIEKGKGSLLPPELKSRITFSKQDSALFDEFPYAGQMDFVFVDGVHHYDYVKDDSEKGWRMLRSGGITAWHDFRPPGPDVVKYFLKSTYNPLWDSGTSLAFAHKP